jgi:hypothetical protein
MSRSRKKNPITGVTTAKSEKSDKVIMNRRLRRRTKHVLFNYDEEKDEYILPVKHDVMNQWSMAKDGRMMHNKPKNVIKCEDCVYQLQCLVGGRREICDEHRDEEWYKQAIRK